MNSALMMVPSIFLHIYGTSITDIYASGLRDPAPHLFHKKMKRIPDEQGKERITFSTQSGKLIVVRRKQLYEMDFPAYDLRPVPITPQMVCTIGAPSKEAYMGRDLLCAFENAAFDCVSRSFAPKLNVAEDPVCGFGHCHIIPYWSKN